KYRPQRFEDLIGQEPMVRTLSNAFETGRIAQAFLLTGVRGVGKTTTARILARALNYSRPGVDRPSLDFSELGEHCAAIMEGRHIDVIEMDAASHTGIGDVREIIEAVRYKPALARYKVYIIDEVHMLSNQAFNGLLKTLEEPPEHVKFVFATTEIRKVPVTVLSRCQRFDLRRIEADRLVRLLTDITAKEGVAIEPEALATVARAAEGSARDALSLLDQAIAHTGGGDAAPVTAETLRTMLGLADRTRVIDLFEEAMRGDAPAALNTLADLYAAGADPQLVLQDLANLTHLVTRLKLVPGAADDPALTEEERGRGRALADGLSLRTLTRCWQILLKGIEEASTAARPLAAADMVIVRIAHAADLPTPDEAVRMLANGGGAVPGTTSAPSPSGGGRAPVEAQRPAGPRLELASTRGAATAVAFTPHTENPAPAREEPPLAIKAFDELPALAAARRDLPLKFALERQVRLIRFEPPRMEIALTPDAPKGLSGDLSARLSEWTGRRWIITIGNGPAAPTLHEQRQSARERLETDARNDPVVAAVLEQFPGAEIVDIRVRAASVDESAALPAPSVEADDSE
ncbi:MAG: DNA polymerase III subunit gamma/tau, partial [Bauldia sp.]